ncbi:hypothetical protein CWC18_18650 [Pseudoalteromonas aurantia]|uniref:DUF5690 family protein n=1 Tax=Pseudoalteromonas aurantia TaxID=43654 RepID=UPI00110B9176|nr:DUF5690 family protein [Pseudoalteromonas aurantia]TMO57393.1 hypothetical protein CWC18_18650 [Pseudoalteromonas aurantia]
MFSIVNKHIHLTLNKNTSLFCIYAIIAACSTYAFMYGFRKPIAVGLYADTTLLGVSLKTLYLTSQIFGYALSKFIGIKVISELQPHGRANTILLLVTIAWLALLGFGYISAPWNTIFMFINGLPLGMVWGIVFSYLEGRKVTEILAAGLCASFIIASGLVKSVGSFLMLNYGVTEQWMPFFSASLFFPMLIVSVWMLEQLPPPTDDDIAARCKRTPMNKTNRKEFLNHFGLSLVLLIIGYTLLTIVRDLRDNFSANIWSSVGFSDAPEIFTLTEIPIAIVVLLVVAFLKLITSNHLAIILNYLLIFSGFLTSLICSLVYQNNQLDPISWMVINGVGLYLAYIPFSTTLFERLIATFNRPANVGFITYISDSFGYLGTVAVMLYHGFITHQVNWNVVLCDISILTGGAGAIITLLSLGYFLHRSKLDKNANYIVKNQIKLS